MQLRRLFEEEELRTIVFTFGRFNPPTIGHEILVNQVKSVAQQYNADYVIFASQSQDKKKNPLSYAEKIFFMDQMFPGTNFNKNMSIKTPFQALEELGKEYDRAVLVVGSDRVPEFKQRMAPYVEEFGYKDLIVVSAGERDPDADGAEGMSASKARELAIAGNLEQFKQAIPGNDKLATMMYNKVREGLGIADLEPVAERSLTKGEEKKKERYVKGMKKAKGDFKDRYGDDAEAVMYATATKMAKESTDVSAYANDEFNKIVATLADAGIPLTKELNQWRQEGGLVNVIRNLIPFINKKFDKMRSYDIDAYLKSADYKSKTQDEKRRLLPALLNIQKAQEVIPEIITQLRIIEKNLESAGITEAGSIASQINWGNQHKDDEDKKKNKKKTDKKSLIAKLKSAVGLGESNLVIDKSRLRSHIISLIADKIAETDDIDQLADWLKYIVGKDLSARGTRYQISSEDVVHALEACKNRRKKMREEDTGPEKIDPLPVPQFPEMPQQDGDLGDGTVARQTKQGMTLSNADGTFLWDASGKPSQWRSPSIAGMSQSHNLKTGVITVRYSNGPLKVTRRFDKNGNSLDKGDTQYGFGDVKMSKNADGSQNELYTAGAYKLEISKDAQGNEKETYWKYNSRTDRVEVDASEVPTDIIANLNQTRNSGKTTQASRG